MNSHQPGSSEKVWGEGGGERSKDGFSTKLKSPHKIISSLGGSEDRKCLRL